MNATRVSRALDALQIPHRLFRHPGPIRSLEQAARERGQRPEQVVRSLVFRLGQDGYVMVLVAGPGRVSWPRLRRYLGRSRLTTATADEVLAVTGYEIGAVSPFGLPRPMRVLVDRNVFAGEEISIGSGQKGTTVILEAQALMQGLGEVEVGDFVA